MEKWDLCGGKIIEEELEGRVCYGGLDLSSTTDITAFSLVFPPINDEEKYIILPGFLIESNASPSASGRITIPAPPPNWVSSTLP